jgi:hypothetical protein
LLSGKDKALLVRRNANDTLISHMSPTERCMSPLPFLVLDLRFHVVDRVRRFDFESDGLSRKGLHEDLHSEGWWLYVKGCGVTRRD